MRPIWILARNTFKEVIRDRILYAAVVFAVLLIGLSLALGQLTFAEQARITTNFGLSAIHLAAVALAIFIGSNLVHKEIEKKTIVTILSRAISRTQFILGKTLGLSLLIVTMISSLSVILAGTFFALGVTLDGRFAVVLLGLVAEALVLLGITLVFSMITRPILVACFSFGIFLIGHWQSSLGFFARKAGGGPLVAVDLLCRYAIPDLERVNWKELVLYDQPIDWTFRAISLGYAGAWFAACVSLTILLFRGKDVG